MAWRAILSRSLKLVRFLFCQPSPGSAAAREVAKNCGDVNALNPSLPFLARECSDVQPLFWARYGNYGHGFNRKLGSKVGEILIGQAVILIGLSNGSAFAQENTVSLPATSSGQAEGGTSGLQRIEDGSVISNEHTIKWRIFTDKGDN